MGRKKRQPSISSNDNRPLQPLVNTMDILHSFSDRLAHLRKENAQRAQQMDETCAALEGDLALTMSRLQAETAQQQQEENCLRQERDELRKALAELKHQQRKQQRAAAVRNNDCIIQTTANVITPTSEHAVDNFQQERMPIEYLPTDLMDAIHDDDSNDAELPLPTSSTAQDNNNATTTTWQCVACTYENSSLAMSCEMCQTAKSLAPPVVPAITSLLLEMGYSAQQIQEAMDALNDADKNKPEQVIYSMDQKVQRLQQEEERLQQEKLKQERAVKEKEAKERVARKKAEEEAEKRARQEAEEAEERQAREAADRLRREAREAKERARMEREQQENAARLAEQQERRKDDAVANAPVPVVKAEKESPPSSDGPVADKDAPMPAKATEHANKMETSVSLVKPTAAIRAIPKSPVRGKKTVMVDKLSQYMYPEASEGTDASAVSPIFGMLQNESTIEAARKLLSLEDRCARLKKEASDLRREHVSNEQDIASRRAKEAALDDELVVRQKRIETRLQFVLNQKSHSKYKTKAMVLARIKEIEKAVKENEEKAKEGDDSQGGDKPSKKVDKKKIENEMKTLRDILQYYEEVEKEKESAPKRLKEVEDDIDNKRTKLKASIDDLLGKAKKTESVYRVKLNLVEKKRDEIAMIKKTGEAEDARFDINGTRDEHGNTFLMVATQNNDLATARLLFQLGASPNAKGAAGLTAMDLARYFSIDEMADLIAQNGGSENSNATWSVLATKAKALHPIDWETQLQIAERAAIPADTKLSSEEDPIADETALLSATERRKKFTCFDSSLLEPSATKFRRVVLLESDVYSWFSEADATERSGLCNFLSRLQSSSIEDRDDKTQAVSCHRRFVIGVKRSKQFEVLCAALNPTSNANAPVPADALVVFYSPFVESYIHGVSNVGVLVWAVTTESKASRYISLIEAAEFLRHKVDDPNERFPSHRDGVLELGKDMHLLDLKATSIFTGSAMELLTVDMDKNDLVRMENDDFIPPKRLLHHEQQLQQAIFRSTEKESSENQGILSMARPDLSTNLFGGAGTGKTLISIRKMISEDVGKRILFVSRLPRLISFVKSAVDAERDTSNVAFFTYDDLLNHLARRIEPEDEEERRTFSTFNQVHFGEMTGTGAASSALEEGERKAMKDNLVEPITLWGAFRVIKSSAKCSVTKVPLSQDEYLNLPRSFGLNKAQRTLVYKLYSRYSEWLNEGMVKWDEADRALYVLRFGPSVFTDCEFVSWEERAFRHGEVDLLEDDKMPLGPFFYHAVFADEAQDFSELDMALFIRMSSSVRSLFIGADPAQSVELGIRMRVGTVNGVFHSSLPKHHKNLQVKNVLQEIQLKTNHRTHARNLEIGKAVRKILTRSFGVPNSNENALMEGTMPEALLLKKMRDLRNDKVFRGGNIVFIAPDEKVTALRSLFLELGVKNDVFGVREAKGLEFPSIALIGFFEYFQALGNQTEWENVIRWLFSKKGITTTESAEMIQGKSLENCDYVLSCPEIEDQAMMLYTGLTRARGALYFVEVADAKKRKGKGLAEFAFRQLQQLRLLKIVSSIDEGEVDMTPQQHKARGVLLVVQAINMSRNQASIAQVKDKFADAQARFQVDKGNDKHLLDQCNKHLEAIMMKYNLIETIRTKFFIKEKGDYDLQGCFEDILGFEQEAAKFFRLCANDSFLVEEIQEMRKLIEDVFYGTPYETHFGEICDKIESFESYSTVKVV